MYIRVYNSIDSCDGASLKRAIGVHVGFCAAFLAEHDDRSLAIEPFSVFRLKFRGDTCQLSPMPFIID